MHTHSLTHTHTYTYTHTLTHTHTQDGSIQEIWVYWTHRGTFLFQVHTHINIHISIYIYIYTGPLDSQGYLSISG